MFCKFCGHPLPEGSDICQSCGKDNNERVKKPLPLWSKIVIAAVSCIALVASLGAMLYYGIYGTLAPRENNVFYRKNYTVSDKKFEANQDKVVATIGDATLTNSQLRAIYWIHIHTYGQYYQYDPMKPLNEQVYDEATGKTWQQFILEGILDIWHEYQAIALAAEAAGFQMPEDAQKMLAEMKDTVTKEATQNGFASLDELMRKRLGAGATFEDYYNYFATYYKANLYYKDFAENVSVTPEEIDAFYAGNSASLYTKWKKKVTKEMGDLVDVRHILLKPKGGTYDEVTKKTVYTEEEWAACLKEAEKVMQEWKDNGEDEDAFGDLAYLYTADSNGGDGGLYEDVSKGIMVKEFEDWCFAENRKYGDCEIVRTDIGYHLIFFVAREDGYLRYCTMGAKSEKAAKMLEEAKAKYALNVDYTKILLPGVDLSHQKK